MFKPPTLKDVARAAGVHFTTVSMALRGHPAIAAATRVRLESIAAKLGYRRVEVFSALTQRRQERGRQFARPGLLYLGRAPRRRQFFEMAHHRAVLAGARQQAEDFGYCLETVFVGPGGVPPDQLTAYLRKHSARGVVIGAWDPGMSAPAVDWSGKATVKIDSWHIPADVPVVSNDQLANVVTALTELRRRGYRRIGLAMGEHDDEGTGGAHLSGLQLAHARLAPRERVPPHFFPARTRMGPILEGLGRWLSAHRVDAVVSNWASIRSMLQAIGRSVPGDVGCACICRGRHQHELAGIIPNLELVGRTAITVLAMMVRDAGSPRAHAASNTCVQGVWRPGRTLRPAPSNA